MTDVTIVMNQKLRENVVQNVTVWSNGPLDQVDRESFTNAFRLDFIAAGVQNDLISDWSMESLTFVYNATLPSFSVTVPFDPSPINGTGIGDGTASQVALLVSTQYVGPPPNRGRVYFAGLEQNAIANSGFWQTAIVTQFQDLVTSWQNGISYAGGSNTAFLRIARRLSDGSIDTTNPVEEAVGRRNPAIQRRRRQGQGV